VFLSRIRPRRHRGLSLAGSTEQIHELTRMTTCTTVTWAGHNAGCGFTSDTPGSRPIPVYTAGDISLCLRAQRGAQPTCNANTQREDSGASNLTRNFTASGIRLGGGGAREKSVAGITLNHQSDFIMRVSAAMGNSRSLARSLALVKSIPAWMNREIASPPLEENAASAEMSENRF